MEAYENDLYWVYFEDVLFVPMLFFYAQKIVFINDLYYLHRHHEIKFIVYISAKRIPL